LVGSASINTPHRWESKYYQWVTNARGLLYYGEPFGPQPGLWSAMYLIGNPIIVWGCGIGIIVFFVSVLYHARFFVMKATEASKAMGRTLRVCWCVTAASSFFSCCDILMSGLNRCRACVCYLLSFDVRFLFFGWLFNLLPYIAVTRQAFVYHYMPGLLFAEILVPLWLQGALPKAYLPHVFRLAVFLIAV
jgi:dolichyl-phosphate-mannose--protein O-mannosyl transferase